MQDFQYRQRIISLLTAALECSFYVSPKDPGLTYAELLEFGRVFELQAGEIGDVMQQVATTYAGRSMIHPNSVFVWTAPHFVETPEYMNTRAFDFWRAALHESARANGIAHARVDRDTTIERAVASGIPRHDMEVALTINRFLNRVTEKEGVVALPSGVRSLPPPITEQRSHPGLAASRPKHNEFRENAYPVVQDIIGRRTDGRSSHVEALDAFAEKLSGLGYGNFRLWWVQMVSQFRRTDPETTPIPYLVLAAALVEGALTFVVTHGRSLGAGVFGSNDFSEPPHKWKTDDLIKGASAGQSAAILDQKERLRAESLVRTRQRIHAGRMLSEFPQGVPDLRPEEARDAKAIADLVVRRILDWLERHPVS